MVDIEDSSYDIVFDYIEKSSSQSNPQKWRSVLRISLFFSLFLMEYIGRNKINDKDSLKIFFKKFIGETDGLDYKFNKFGLEHYFHELDNMIAGPDELDKFWADFYSQDSLLLFNTLARFEFGEASFDELYTECQASYAKAQHKNFVSGVLFQDLFDVESLENFLDGDAEHFEKSLSDLAARIYGQRGFFNLQSIYYR
ncbi:hypothetical protein [Halovulum sp. GXIMD14793]